MIVHARGMDALSGGHPMQSILRSLTWAFFALLAYLVATNILSYWVELPAPGNIGFVLVFTLFSGCIAA